MDYVAAFLAGAFLCNCVPHLTCGLRGEIFPTPFAKPRGKGPSSPLVNFLWGFFNLLVGLFLLSRHSVAVDLSPGFAALTADWASFLGTSAVLVACDLITCILSTAVKAYC